MPQVNDIVWFEPTDSGKKVLRDSGLGFLVRGNTKWVSMAFWNFLSVFGPEFPQAPGVVREHLVKDGMIYFEKPY